MRTKIMYALMVAVLFACNESSNTKKGTDSSGQQLVGEWNNLSLKVDIRSKNNSDSNEVLDIILL